MTFHLSEYFDISTFKNKEVDSLYFFNAMGQFAQGLISVFIPIYLFNLGFPIWQIILFYFLRSAYYLTLGTSLLPVMKVLSDKILMVLSIPPLVLFFMGLNYINGLSALFFILPALAAINMLFMFIPYHLDFTVASDDGHIGSEVGARFVINAIVKFATPFLGGLIIGMFGFDYVYILASAILILSIIPLFSFPKRNVSSNLTVKKVWRKIKADNLFSYNISSMAYGAEKMALTIIWPLFLFIIVGGIEELGGIVSAGFIIGALISFFLGKRLDDNKGSGDRITKWSTTTLSIVWFLKSFITTTIPAVASHIIDNISRNMLLISWKTKFYKIAEQDGDTGLFIVSQEFIYHIARVIILPIFGLFAYLLTQHMFFIASFVLAAILSLGFLVSNNHRFKKIIK